ncbi:MAG: peptidylprolyl isomerase, partial [Planctomycetota bacterium]|nr:peptidylprolyl isomerase [Planctomycetota bacterium]
LLQLALLPGCKKETEPVVPGPEADRVESVFSSEDVPDSELGDFHVTLEVAIDGKPVGEMKVRLWSKLAPITTRNFLTICSMGFYDGLTFHRVLSNFMVQGGCEHGVGSGSGPLPPLKGEFSSRVEAQHVYGTLSMARGPSPDSAGAQFFIICDEGPPAWSLDGEYASFGQVVDGGSTLEAIAAVPVEPGVTGEPSRPTRSIEILRATVHKGALPDAQPIELPIRAQDQMGWPNTVEVQTLLVAVGGGILPVERSVKEAETLAKSLLERALAGEDFDALVAAHSDDPVQKGTQPPPGYRFAQTGSHPKLGQKEVYEMNNEFQERFNALGTAKRAGELDSKQVADQARSLQIDLMRQIRKVTTIPKSQRRALADRAFQLEVGEIQLIPRDPARTLEGYYLMRRVR